MQQTSLSATGRRSSVQWDSATTHGWNIGLTKGYESVRCGRRWPEIVHSARVRLCNQSVFKHFRKRCKPPNLYCSGYSRTSRLASPGSQDDASMSIVSDLRIFVRSRCQARKSFPTNGLMRTGVLLTPSALSPAPSEIRQPMRNRRIQRVPKNAEPYW